MTETVVDKKSGTGRKPRIVVAGEFSAGKSKLINGLLGKDVLPSNVTSTALPPIWLVGDASESLIICRDGSVMEFDLDKVDIDEAAYCVLSSDAEILQHVDLIDTPGNSDPNIPAECWEQMVQYADGMIWCTSAMQAWKQTEKATVTDLPEDLRAQATLLITQADRMPDEKSAGKVERRVNREAGQYFCDVMMGSMLNADDVQNVRDRIMKMAAEISLRGVEEPKVDKVRRSGVSQQEPATAKEPRVTGPWAIGEVTADKVTTAIVAKVETVPATKATPASATQDVSATSNGLPNGKVAELWAEVSEGADLSDNAEYLTRIEALLKNVNALLSHESPKTPAQAKAV